MVMFVGVTVTYLVNWRNTLKTIKHPKDTQSETVNVPVFFCQIFSYFFFSVMFIVVGYIGNEPIAGADYPWDVSRGYIIAWLCWYFFVIVH